MSVFSSERLQRINQLIQRYIDDKQIIGAVTVVTRRGRTAHFEAHGLMDAPKPGHRCGRMASSGWRR